MRITKFYEKFSQGINHGYFENSYYESLKFSILTNILPDVNVHLLIRYLKF